MRDGGDILALGRNIKQAMAEIQTDLPIGIEPVLFADQAVTVDHAINEFTTSLWQAILIIIAASFLSLGVRPGAVVALSIPLTLAIVFPIMDFFGIDLQRISLGALIIALTLLVDDAMTTVDAMMRRLAAGDSKEGAATFAYRSLAAPMLTGTLVTIAGFVPIGFAASGAGEYTFSIFAVVGIALIVSWFVAVIFAPLIGMAVLKAPKDQGSGEPGRIMGLYRGLLIGAMRARWLTILVTIGLFGAALLGTRLVSQQFFPASDRPELVVDLGLPHNASIYASETAAERLDGVLKRDQDVERWSTYVGQGAIRFYLPLDVQLPNDFFSQAVIVAKDVAARDLVARRSSRRCWRRTSRARSPGSTRSNSGRRSAGRCSIASAGRTWTRCGRSRSSSRRSWRATPMRGASTSTGTSRRARYAFMSIRMRRAGSASAHRRWRRRSMPRSPDRP